jgi:cysteine desulfurase
MTLYLDCNATTPLDPRVQAEINRCFSEEWGNAGSPHEFGRRTKYLVHAARDRIARVVAAKKNDIVFTSGATESNNLAILGLAEHGAAIGKRHIVSTQIEHKSVLEPLAMLRKRGFEVTLVPPAKSGRVTAVDVSAALRPDTLLVSMMHVNNETGVIQPIGEIGESLRDADVFFHVDAAQGFGKDIESLRHPRIDLISVSSHKIFGPAGVGAIIVRHRRGHDVPLMPLMFGGGQELGLRPGTLPAALISGFGLAAEVALDECAERQSACRRLRSQIVYAIRSLEPMIHGDPDAALPHVLNVSFPRLEGEQVIELLEGVAAVSTGSACTSVCATSSHVLAAMQVVQPALDGAVRFSWSHRTDPEQLDRALSGIVERLSGALSPKAISSRGDRRIQVRETT